jgi:hypothetical protein
MTSLICVIFMGDGGPEDRPESVPSDEVEAALGPLDLHAHQVEELTEDGGEYLWQRGLSLPYVLPRESGGRSGVTGPWARVPRGLVTALRELAAVALEERQETPPEDGMW